MPPGQFRKQPLDHWPIAYWKIGPKRGQPKVCDLCPSFAIRAAGQPYLRLCAVHYQQWLRDYHKRQAARIHKEKADFWLGRTRPPRKPLDKSTVKPSQRKDYKGPLQHLPPGWREIAEKELKQLLADHPPRSALHYAHLVACATSLAKFGGRKLACRRMLTFQQQRGRFRNQLAAASASEAASQNSLDKLP